MGLETSTFISGLTATWPLAGDKKNQGDDHFRLIKTTLQATFPVADRAFYFPKSEITAVGLPLDATDQNNDVLVDTSAGNVAITLPSTLGTGDKGWECSIVKTTSDTNAVIVSPSSGTIASRVGATATIRVGIVCDPVRFKWNGTGWLCYKHGPMIGSTENFDGATTPAGYLDADASVYSNTNFAELFAVLVTTTLKDKRGRAEIGSGAGTGLTNRVLGTNYGAETKTLVTANLPAYTPAGAVATTTVPGGSGQYGASILGGPLGYGGAAAGGNLHLLSLSSTSTFTGTPQGGTSTPVDVIPPTVAVKKIIRAC